MHSHELILHLATENTIYPDDFRQDVVGIMPVRTLDRDHPAQKPGELVEFLLMASSESDIVLDPFMGSGTTGIACIRTGRRFIGIEIDEHYFEVAKERIQRELRQQLLPL